MDGWMDDFFSFTITFYFYLFYFILLFLNCNSPYFYFLFFSPPVFMFTPDTKKSSLNCKFKFTAFGWMVGWMHGWMHFAPSPLPRGFHRVVPVAPRLSSLGNFSP